MSAGRNSGQQRESIIKTQQFTKTKTGVEMIARPGRDAGRGGECPFAFSAIMNSASPHIGWLPRRDTAQKILPRLGIQVDAAETKLRHIGNA
jgi:hypothetical protein